MALEGGSLGSAEVDDVYAVSRPGEGLRAEARVFLSEGQKEEIQGYARAMASRQAGKPRSTVAEAMRAQVRTRKKQNVASAATFGAIITISAYVIGKRIVE